MKNTLLIYIVMGVLFIVPLILFNIRKIWVRKPGRETVFKPGRLVFVVLMSAFITVFLMTAYNQTLENRFEIALERVAEQHAESIVGKKSKEDFRKFVIENGTDNVKQSLDATVFPEYGSVSEASFQISDWCVPKDWQGEEGFEQTEVLDDTNPVYVMYRMKAGSQKDFFVLRMVKTDDGWKCDWFGNANETHKKAIKMPSEKNGKWFTVNAE